MFGMETCILLYWKRRKFHENKRIKRKKRLWVRPIFEKHIRNKFGAGNNLVREMANQIESQHHLNFFRMMPVSFENLLLLLKVHVLKVTARREPISPEIRLAITLRYLASGDSMSSISYLFRVGLSTVSEIISETTQIIWDVLQPLVLKPPTQDDWKNIAIGYETRWQFPNCIGAIDGKHIVVQAPPNAGSEFYNYKGMHSLVLLAVVDYKYSFILVDIGAPGRQSDGGILLNSEIGKRLRRNELNIPPARVIAIDRPEVPYVIVGDEAFPLSANLLRPYPSKSPAVEQQIFNYRLSRACLTAENTFGILSSRWRIFKRPMIGKLENVENSIKACICLHNYLMGQPESKTYVASNIIDRENDDGTILPDTF